MMPPQTKEQLKERCESAGWWPLSHLFQGVREQVVHEATDPVAVGQPGGLPPPLDVMQNAFDRVGEATQVFRKTMSGGVRDLFGKLRLSETAEGALGVVDDHDLARAESSLRDRQ